MEKSEEYYLSKGFDHATAAYFASGRKKPVSVQPNPDFTLTLHFDNGEIRLLNAKPFLQPNTVFAPFCVWEAFRRVYLDEEGAVCWDVDPDVDSHVVWSNKVDLSPDSCYLDSTPLYEFGLQRKIYKN